MELYVGKKLSILKVGEITVVTVSSEPSVVLNWTFMPNVERSPAARLMYTAFKVLIFSPEFFSTLTKWIFAFAISPVSSLRKLCSIPFGW